jgi:cation diffusion facilitator CzcD-associated flavoprotein CzcO
LEGQPRFAVYSHNVTNGARLTWQDNTYPGCACDIPSHYYSLSTDLNPNWSRSFATQPELRAYWEHIADKYDLYSRISFSTLVTRSEWDPSTQLWKVTIKNLTDRTEQTVTAPILVSALGVLEVPKWPSDMKGLADFKGDLFHAARWDHSVSLKGKRVGVIGNGATV